jgi:hypothetical protein
MDGCHNATQIHKEIVEQGYPGAYNNVVRITQYLKKCERDAEPLPDSLLLDSLQHRRRGSSSRAPRNVRSKRH